MLLAKKCDGAEIHIDTFNRRFDGKEVGRLYVYKWSLEGNETFQVPARPKYAVCAERVRELLKSVVKEDTFETLRDKLVLA